MAGIYIHIPFCKQACYYCDFHFTTNQRDRSEVVEALKTEILLQRDYLAGEQVDTIYFGGGTPSILSEGELNAILKTIRTTFPVAATAEVTLEANPDDLSDTKLKEIRDAGINRLSIGLQSFDDAILRSLNRAHDARMSVACVHAAYDAGFTNISLDLIYAIPEQDDALWGRNIDQVLMLKPQHISSYSLTIEEKTVFGKWAKQGRLTAVPDDHAATQLQILVERLEAANYLQYEVSNFSRPGFESQHNSNYWRNKKYLGIGPSAHSYNGDSRQYNISNNQRYLACISMEQIPATLELLTREDKVNEYLLTTLRTSWGTNLAKLRDEFAFDLLGEQARYIGNLQVNDLATIEKEFLILTKKGKLLADKIASDLFLIRS